MGLSRDLPDLLLLGAENKTLDIFFEEKTFFFIIGYECFFRRKSIKSSAIFNESSKSWSGLGNHFESALHVNIIKHMLLESW